MQKHLIMYGHDYGKFPADVAEGIANSKKRILGGSIKVTDNAITLK